MPDKPETTKFKIRADILDPDDGEAFIGEVHSGIVLERFDSLSDAQNMLERNRPFYERIAHERIGK